MNYKSTFSDMIQSRESYMAKPLLAYVTDIFFSFVVLDEPKPPGAVELEQIVHGKVIVSWEASPDQELDNRLYYMVSEHDSSTRMWHTVADRIFDNSYTANNIMPGREYHFKIYAKNDMGMSDPSMSPTWGINSNRSEFSSQFRFRLKSLLTKFNQRMD